MDFEEDVEDFSPKAKDPRLYAAAHFFSIPEGYISTAEACNELSELINVSDGRDPVSGFPRDYDPYPFDAEVEKVRYVEMCQRADEPIYAVCDAAIDRAQKRSEFALWTKLSPTYGMERLSGKLYNASDLNFAESVKNGFLIFRENSEYYLHLRGMPIYIKDNEWQAFCDYFFKYDDLFMYESAQSRSPSRMENSQLTKTRLPDALLQAWWKGLSAEAAASPFADLLNLARSAFPDHAISRERVRELDPGRKRGPKPFSG